MKTAKNSLLLSTLICLGASPLWPAVQPYQLDADTLALFLLDEDNSAANAADAVIDDPLTPFPGSSTEYGFGFASAEGFTNGFRGGNSILRNPRFTADRMQGDDGAFTYEVIFRVDSLDPIPSGLSARTILGWAQGGNFGQIRLNIDNDTKAVSIAVYNSVGALDGGVNMSIPLPTAGPHAFQLGRFYHFAFAYDGNDGVEGNVQLYWTALDSNATQAEPLPFMHLVDQQKIGKDQNFDLLANTWLVIGGDIGGTDRLFPGLIDNVRISSVARQPGEFIFYDDGSGPTGPLTPGDWTATDIGFVYGYNQNWGYSGFMGFVYMGDGPWIYQSHFGWIFLNASIPHSSSTNFWLYNFSLGWIYANDAHGGFFQSQNTTPQWDWNNFLNPNP
jgi:hypothetical protein